MKRGFSIYLDLVRIVAAFAVFIGHAVGYIGGIFWQLEPYQHEAVIVFFVLSGFLIAYATDRREITAREYTVARAARIYSVVIPALLITAICDLIGTSATPAIYITAGAYWHFLPQLVFVNELWGNFLQPGSNGPFWTLTLEVWYYTIFGIFIFSPRRWRWILSITALIVIGFGPAYLFFHWLAGVCAYHAQKHRLSQVMQWILCVAPLLVWLAYEVMALRGHRWLTPPSFMSGRKMFYQDFMVSICFSLHLVGFAMLSRSLTLPALPEPLAKAIRWCAGASFTLYLVHLPVMMCLSALSPWPRASWLTRAMILIGVPIATLLAAEFGERRKAVWQRWFRALLSPAQDSRAVRQS